MNSREIVLATLEYTGVERVAGSMPAPYWNDLSHASYRLEGFSSIWQDVGDGRQEYVDEWGNTWARVDDYSKGEVARGAVETLDKVDAVPLPDLANPANYANVRAVFGDPQNDRFRVGGLPGFPFNIVRKMRRLDQFLMDLLLDQDKILALLKRIENLLAEVIVQYGAAGADGVMFPEDWGTQKGLMIHPQLWRQVFKPGFERLCSVAHEHGLKVLMHSCGKTTVIIPDLIEAGIDLLQFDQPQLHGLDNLARYHGEITFWCPVDIQTTLQTRDAEAIEADARAMIEKLGGPQGGFIAGYYSGNEAIGLDPQWQDVACRAFTKYGDYRRK
jgi:uroporphyrinogen decarboxylase